LAAASACFKSLGLDFDLIEPPGALAHPSDDGSALLVRRSLAETAAMVGAEYRKLISPAVHVAPRLLGPVRCLAPRPAKVARFAISAARSATDVAPRLVDEHARTLFLGACAHSILPLDRRGSAGAGLVLLSLAHTTGWPFPRGGSQAIADALATRLRSLGGEIETGH